MLDGAALVKTSDEREPLFFGVIKFAALLCAIKFIINPLLSCLSSSSCSAAKREQEKRLRVTSVVPESNKKKLNSIKAETLKWEDEILLNKTSNSRRGRTNP